jgi:DNA-binding FadR family transcriptional regulator
MTDLRSVPDERIRIPKAAELVANTLRRRIVTEEYQPDELLPPEGALMASFSVARTTIRDAFRVLESEGLVVVRRGANGGARVKVPSVSMVSDNASVLLQFRGATLEDVHQGRMMVEVPVVGMLASKKANRRIVRELRAALVDEETAMADSGQLSLAEGRFHLRLVELADSPHHCHAERGDQSDHRSAGGEEHHSAGDRRGRSGGSRGGSPSGPRPVGGSDRSRGRRRKPRRYGVVICRARWTTCWIPRERPARSSS